MRALLAGPRLFQRLGETRFGRRQPDHNWGNGSSDYMMSFYAREFWRFTFVQKRVAALAKTAIEYPPMQKGASFNLEAVKAQIVGAIQARNAQ